VTTTLSSQVVTARTWLARWGWRRHGRLDADDAPAPKVMRKRTTPRR
jgi:hypothetical protein